MATCFFWLEASFFDCFCEACFCTDFGDLSPMMGYLSLSYLTFGMFVSPKALVFVFEESSSGKLGGSRLRRVVLGSEGRGFGRNSGSSLAFGVWRSELNEKPRDGLRPETKQLLRPASDSAQNPKPKTQNRHPTPNSKLCCTPNSALRRAAPRCAASRGGALRPHGWSRV